MTGLESFECSYDLEAAGRKMDHRSSILASAMVFGSSGASSPNGAVARRSAVHNLE